MDIVDAAQPVEISDDTLIDTGNGNLLTWGELQKRRHRDRSDDYFGRLKAVMRARREERDKLVDLIEVAIYEAKGSETVDALMRLAGKVLA